MPRGNHNQGELRSSSRRRRYINKRNGSSSGTCRHDPSGGQGNSMPTCNGGMVLQGNPPCSSITNPNQCNECTWCVWD